MDFRAFQRLPTHYGSFPYAFSAIMDVALLLKEHPAGSEAAPVCDLTPLNFIQQNLDAPHLLFLTSHTFTSSFFRFDFSEVLLLLYFL